MNDDPSAGTPTLESLIESDDIVPEMLVCPSGGILNYIAVPLTREQLERGGHNQVWMYEPLDNHREGGNILFSDGRVLFVRTEEYNRLIRGIGKED